MKLEEIYDKCKDIKYGYFDKNGKMLSHISDGFLKHFRLQSIEHIIETNTGICWEAVELLRYYLESNGYECKTYIFIVPATKFYDHSIAVTKYNNKYYWIEASIKELKGVREYNSLKELFFDLLDNFDNVMYNRPFKYKNIKIYEYKKPKENSNCLQFIYNCFSGKEVTSEYMEEYLKNIAQNKNK